MKDKEARIEIARLQAQTTGEIASPDWAGCDFLVNANAWRRLATDSLAKRLKLVSEQASDIERRLDHYKAMLDLFNRNLGDLESHANLHEKPCPECKRLTLMKRIAPTWTIEEALTVISKPTRFYCYSCGGTFSEKTALELVKEPESGS